MFTRRKILPFLVVAIASATAASVISEPSKEIECYSQKKVYHSGTDSCYKLLTKGPCESGEWLVLERPRSDSLATEIKPVCAREVCDEGAYYWASENSCVEHKDAGRLCGRSPDEELVNNVFGEAECSCAKEPPRARLNGDKRNPCYQLYTRGPCKAGEVFIVPQHENRKAVCAPDPCHAEKSRYGRASNSKNLAPFENGTCYELGTRGPCEGDLVFKVHANLLKPSCSSLTTAIFAVQKPQNCHQDENGDCRQRYNNNKRTEAEKFKKELLQIINN